MRWPFNAHQITNNVADATYTKRNHETSVIGMVIQTCANARTAEVCADTNLASDVDALSDYPTSPPLIQERI